MYSFGTYTFDTETFRWSSISFTSLRASSMGWTWVRKARPKTPSKRPSIFDSMVRSTAMGRGTSATSVEVVPVSAATKRGGMRPRRDPQSPMLPGIRACSRCRLRRARKPQRGRSRLRRRRSAMPGEPEAGAPRPRRRARRRAAVAGWPISQLPDADRRVRNRGERLDAKAPGRLVGDRDRRSTDRSEERGREHCQRTVRSASRGAACTLHDERDEGEEPSCCEDRSGDEEEVRAARRASSGGASRLRTRRRGSRRSPPRSRSGTPRRRARRQCRFAGRSTMPPPLRRRSLRRAPAARTGAAWRRGAR